MNIVKGLLMLIGGFVALTGIAISLIYIPMALWQKWVDFHVRKWARERINEEFPIIQAAVSKLQKDVEKNNEREGNLFVDVSVLKDHDQDLFRWIAKLSNQLNELIPNNQKGQRHEKEPQS
jgi:hypothetical protein